MRGSPAELEQWGANGAPQANRKVFLNTVPEADYRTRWVCQVEVDGES